MEREDSLNDSTDPNVSSCNFLKFHENMQRSLKGTDDVDLDDYLLSYKELYNLFVILGGAFSFVASDVKSKIKILENLRSPSDSPKDNHFETVKTMLSYEKDADLLNNSKYVSGSRTLLRLHRGLDFLWKFLGGVLELDRESSVYEICRKSYDEALAVYHPWVVRKSATIAMKFLPTKAELMRRMTNGDAAEEKKATDAMPDILKSMEAVYVRVDNLYTFYKLHDLK